MLPGGDLMIEARAQAGWKELTERLRAFVGHRVPEADADDVLQDALVRIQKGLPALRDDERFGPWVYRIARSAIGDRLRARARPLEDGRTPVDDDIEGNSHDPGDDLTPALVGCLSSFIAELPSPYREAITLTELEGLTQKAASEMLGVSLSGMKSRVQRGRARLREMFDRCCEMTQDARGRVIGCEPRAGCSPAADATPAGAPYAARGISCEIRSST
jgi:RNA polymerase sigma-70 factor (ECF subfamily)